jgi:hypothetical protein
LVGFLEGVGRIYVAACGFWKVLCVKNVNFGKMEQSLRKIKRNVDFIENMLNYTSWESSHSIAG